MKRIISLFFLIFSVISARASVQPVFIINDADSLTHNQRNIVEGEVGIYGSVQKLSDIDYALNPHRFDEREGRENLVIGFGDYLIIVYPEENHINFKEFFEDYPKLNPTNSFLSPSNFDRIDASGPGEIVIVHKDTDAELQRGRIISGTILITYYTTERLGISLFLSGVVLDKNLQHFVSNKIFG